MTPYYDYQGITIYHGDCREILPGLQAGAMITDPPYGISHSSSYGASWEDTEIEGDHDTAIRDKALAWARSRKIPWIAFGSWKASVPGGVRGCLVWDKGPASGMGDLGFPWKPSWEQIYVGGLGWQGRRDEGVLRGPTIITWESKGRKHPHEKPLWLVRHFMNKLSADLVIVDPFTGTGPVLRAALDLGRRAIGIEIEERYCEIAARRLEQNVLALDYA